jgi:hypothetical protein
MYPYPHRLSYSGNVVGIQFAVGLLVHQNSVLLLFASLGGICGLILATVGRGPQGSSVGDKMLAFECSVEACVGHPRIGESLLGV